MEIGYPCIELDEPLQTEYPGLCYDCYNDDVTHYGTPVARRRRAEEEAEIKKALEASLDEPPPKDFENENEDLVAAAILASLSEPPPKNLDQEDNDMIAEAIKASLQEPAPPVHVDFDEEELNKILELSKQTAEEKVKRPEDASGSPSYYRIKHSFGVCGHEIDAGESKIERDRDAPGLPYFVEDVKGSCPACKGESSAVHVPDSVGPPFALTEEEEDLGWPHNPMNAFAERSGSPLYPTDEDQDPTGKGKGRRGDGIAPPPPEIIVGDAPSSTGSYDDYYGASPPRSTVSSRDSQLVERGTLQTHEPDNSEFIRQQRVQRFGPGPTAPRRDLEDLPEHNTPPPSNAPQARSIPDEPLPGYGGTIRDDDELPGYDNPAREKPEELPTYGRTFREETPEPEELPNGGHILPPDIDNNPNRGAEGEEPPYSTTWNLPLPNASRVFREYESTSGQMSGALGDVAEEQEPKESPAPMYATVDNLALWANMRGRGSSSPRTGGRRRSYRDV
ncbi:hypothetical protein M501DRAFT_999462 [Patellaria atrata CBS 101060]|uniref:Uncharacterized protein n=1 Tax=Patellaria atrata CBS 101060 TaxID=1346257 RepID=A0A9P4S2Q2_9PEZI|nr:hypothetical protein M501DRAFT_999462 [Patellaria atrata CBS 101060]